MDADRRLRVVLAHLARLEVEMNAPLPTPRSALCHYWPAGLFLVLSLSCARTIPEVKAAPQVEQHQIDSFFYLRARALYRECSAHDRPFLTIRQIAEALDRCDFDQKCEEEVCWQIHGDVAGDAPQAPTAVKPLSYRWPMLGTPAPHYGPPPHYRKRTVQDQGEEPIPGWPERQKCETKCWKEHCDCYYGCTAKATDEYGKHLCSQRCEKQHHSCDKKCGEGNT